MKLNTILHQKINTKLDPGLVARYDVQTEKSSPKFHNFAYVHIGHLSQATTANNDT